MATPIESYIQNAPQNQQSKLKEIYQLLKKALPDAKEKISYQLPTFYWYENVVHFGGFKTHLGFYPTATPIVEFKDELTAYKTSKGAIHFPYDQELPTELILKIVQSRIAAIRIKHNI